MRTEVPVRSQLELQAPRQCSLRIAELLVRQVCLWSETANSGELRMGA